MDLDTTERQILRLLQHDGRLSNVALSEQVGLSESPCFRRVKRLEETGLIEGYAAVVNQQRQGLTVTAFVQVSLERQPDTTAEFIQQVAGEEHIVECHATSGAHDYLMKVVARDVAHFSELCMERILRFPGVRHVESSFSLKAIKDSRVLPV
ncbi:MAG: Lrp/AsnC family transcriptional regulator [Gammaproteobacteria bacterium]|nr:Lrp/AsnC family transcriptional regulator [Gammaproteobacteria bacterium]